MTKEQIKQIALDIETVLELVAKKHNIELEMHGGNYSDTKFTPRISFNYKNKSGQTELEANWCKYCDAFGLEASLLGNMLPDGSKIIGYNPNKIKYPVILEKGGRQYKTSPLAIIRLLSSQGDKNGSQGINV